MSLALRNINAAITNNRLSGATRINSDGNMVGVDFATTTAQAASTGSKSFTVGSNRDWVVGSPVLVTATDGTANISMTGTVTSYDNGTGALILNITSTGSDTTTTKTSWRIGHTGPRLDHNFVSPFTRLGLRVEDAHTNSLRNGDAVGATTGTIGSSGALPTNWTSPTTGGLSLDVTAAVNERGIAGVNLRFYGTTSGTSAVLRFDSLTQIVTVQGCLWASSFYAKLVAGALTNVTSINNTIEEATSAGAVVNTTQTAFTPTATLQRFIRTLICESATTERVNSGIQLVFNSGVAIDFTMFVGACQLGQMRAQVLNSTAQGGGASTITLNSGASTTDSAYNSQKIVICGGTGAGQIKTITSYVGATKVATVDSAWSTVPDATSTFSIYRTETISNETFTYCPTRSVAATKSSDAFLAADFASFFIGLSPTEGTFYMEATTAAWFDQTFTINPRVFALNDGTTANDHRASRSVASGQFNCQTLRSGVAEASLSGGSVIGDGNTFKASYSYKENLCKTCYNGVVATDTTATMPTGIMQLMIGTPTTAATTGAWNGTIKLLRFFPRAFATSEHLALQSGGM